MKRTLLILAWIAVVVTAVFLRFDDLAARPMHADEATGARIVSKRMDGGGGKFDPKHYHGPLLADLTMPVCRMQGESGWKQMTKGTLRLVTALAGCLLVIIPLAWRRWGGGWVPLLAGGLLATSPLLVYYSRMFIHESLLVLAGMAALACIVRWPRWGLPGLCVGLMFAAKESFVISLLAWTAAAMVLAWENRRQLDAKWCACVWQQWRVPVMVSAGVAAFTALLFYTHGLTHLRGAVDAVRTFFVYETVAGHDKPWDYYLQLMVMPRKSAGMWWFGTPVVLLALLAFVMSFGREVGLPQRCAIRFLAYSALGHAVIYSIFAYKTPWLACLPWAHVCLLAGFSVIGISKRRSWVQVAIALLVVACLATQWRQARRATGRLDSDARNPLAYVPTRKDVERLEEWLLQLRDMDSGLAKGTVAVVGHDYWPLPWYLRGFERVGYWAEAPADVAAFPLVIAMPDQSVALMELLHESHVSVPRGLRAEVPLQLFVNRSVWDEWMNAESP